MCTASAQTSTLTRAPLSTQSLDEDGEDSNDSLADPQRPSSLDPVDELAAGGEASAHGGVLADMAQYFTDEVFQG
jgi:hypothetical protein